MSVKKVMFTEWINFFFVYISGPQDRSNFDYPTWKYMPLPSFFFIWRHFGQILGKFSLPTLTHWLVCAAVLSFGHLICTLISENQGLEKLRSDSNLRKTSGPAHLNLFSVHLVFFSVCHLNFFLVYGMNLKKIQVTNWKKIRWTEKKFRCAGPEVFLRFESDLNFSRPWFSEIKVQNKRPSDGSVEG